MIAWDGERFFLRGETFDYVMRVNAAGYLEHLHFGGKIGGDDLSALAEPYFLPFIAMPPGEELFSLEISASEYGGYGQGDFRTPSVLIEREDGGRASRFLYRSHQILPAPPEMGVLPHARRGETLEITLTDALSPAEIVLVYTVCKDALVRHARIKNTGDAPFVLRKAYSFCLDLPAGRRDIFFLHGRHCAERAPERIPLAHGTFRAESARGTSSHQSNPFLALLQEDCCEDFGECYGAELMYSGSFCLSAERTQTDCARLQGGINECNFSWKLSGGETFVTPQAALFYSDGGLGKLSRQAVDFLREYVSPPEAKRPRPVVANNWEATYFDFDTPKLLSLIDEAACLGADTFVLDDGWFGARNDDRSALGDWFVNGEKLRGGLTPLIERCKARGIKFGIWIEPEMVSRNSDLYRAHPDWAVGKCGTERCESRNQLVLDFSRGEIVQEIYSRIAALLRENDISYVKWDMNRHLTEFYSEGLPAAQQGEFQHRYVLGVYGLAAALKAEFPNVFFEGCSGGGGRFDAGMLFYFPQIWTSDNTDAYDRAKIQWGTSYAYPLSAMSCHVSACPNHQTGRITPFETRGTIASLGATGYELDFAKLTKEERACIPAQIARYRAVEPLLLSGDLYRLLDPFEGNWFAEELVSADAARAYVAGMTAHAEATPVARRLRLKGLNADKRYRVAERGETYSGATLMNAGLPLPRQKDFCAWTWTLEEEK